MGGHSSSDEQPALFPSLCHPSLPRVPVHQTIPLDGRRLSHQTPDIGHRQRTPYPVSDRILDEASNCACCGIPSRPLPFTFDSAPRTLNPPRGPTDVVGSPHHARVFRWASHPLRHLIARQSSAIHRGGQFLVGTRQDIRRRAAPHIPVSSIIARITPTACYLTTDSLHLRTPSIFASSPWSSPASLRRLAAVKASGL